MEQLRERIRQVFPLEPVPTAPIVDAPDNEAIAPVFLGRRWDGLTCRELREKSEAITYLNVPAFLYYLPSFLMATIDDPKTADIIPDHLLFKFGESDAAAIVARLHPDQRTVLAEFLSAYVGGNVCYLGHLAQALDNLEPGWNDV